MSRTAKFGAWIPFVLTACASAGSGEGAPRVPVFFSEEEVPCAHEVAGRVRAEVYPERQPDEQLRRVLGEAGAREGGDGVLVPDEERARAAALVVRMVGTGTARRSGSVGTTRSSAAPESRPVTGWLLIYTDETCIPPPPSARGTL